MMTKRHRRYLLKYPARIARERRMRRIKVRNAKMVDRFDVRRLRRVLGKYVATRPDSLKTRAGKPTIGTRIKNLFRKPTI